AQLWIVSAGYGLVSPDAQLVSYAATFAPGHLDSVVRPHEPRGAALQWWDGLTLWDGPEPGAPRSFAELAAVAGDGTLLVVASAASLDASAADLEAAAHNLSDADRLMVLCAGMRDHDRLAPYRLPADARAQHALGGTRQTLNVRLARWLFQHGSEH